jgi:hypothetical protein
MVKEEKEQPESTKKRGKPHYLVVWISQWLMM